MSPTRDQWLGIVATLLLGVMGVMAASNGEGWAAFIAALFVGFSVAILAVDLGILVLWEEVDHEP